MSIDSILNTGLSSILTNAASLRVTANNIANVNTPGFVRRDVQQQTLAAAGQLTGVTLGDIERLANGYFDRETIAAQGQFSRFEAQSSLMDQVNAALGSPGDGASLSSRLDALYAALGQASLDPGLQANRQGALNQFQDLAQSISDLADTLGTLRTSADQQIGVAADAANTLLRQIYDMNKDIQHAVVGGDTASGLLDQRDQLVQHLAELVGIRTVEQPDGRLFVSTLDGVSLVADTYAHIDYQPSSGPVYHELTIQNVDQKTGLPYGTAQSFEAHSSSGQLRGLIDMRDGTLQDLAEELGAFAQSLALAFNAQHNANAAVPPPGVMEGRQTGLLGTDSLNFTGKTVIGLADPNGDLQHRISIDFTAGTLSVDGGPNAAIGATIGSFVTALNTALGANGTASFANGQLTLSATGSNGFVIVDDANTPSARGGLGFSHVFGLSDLFEASANAIRTTGLQSTDTGGFAPGGVIKLLLKGPNGERVNEVSVSVTGTTIGDMVAALNTAFAGNASFSLDANGQMHVTPSAAYQRYALEVTQDTTVRGGTGESFTGIFGLGSGQAIGLAQSFRLTPALASAPQRLAFALTSLDSSTALGTRIVGPGDNRGLLALQNLSSQQIAFAPAGALPGRNTTLGDYAATFYQDISARGQTIDATRSAQQTRLQQAQKNQSQAEGVNLDEELSKMVQLQQAYNAGTRLLKVAQDLFDQLINVV